MLSTKTMHFTNSFHSFDSGTNHSLDSERAPAEASSYTFSYMLFSAKGNLWGSFLCFFFFCIPTCYLFPSLNTMRLQNESLQLKRGTVSF